MPVHAELRPRGPYSLRLSARHAGDATRRFRDGVLTARVTVDGGHELARAWQRPDGTICIAADSEAGVERLRFALGIDDDHSGFLRRFAADPMLGRALRELAGLRPVRTDTVCLALLRALAGQLIEARRARAIERRIVYAASPVPGQLAAAPTRAVFAHAAPVRLCRDGLSARKAATLVRLCRSIDLERLHDADPAAAASRLQRERGFGPWSVGVVFLEGLGRYDRPLVGDLGLVKLLAAMRGRWVEGWETAELLTPYGEWAGLASVYLLAGWGRGLLPVRRDDLRRLQDAEARLRAAEARVAAA